MSRPELLLQLSLSLAQRRDGQCTVLHGASLSLFKLSSPTPKKCWSVRRFVGRPIFGLPNLIQKVRGAINLADCSADSTAKREEEEEED